MLWLFDEKPSEQYTFSQIYILNKKDIFNIDDNTVYKLEKTISDKDGNTNKEVNKEIKDIQPIEFKFCVRQMGQLISWTDLDTKKTITFSKKQNILESEKNGLDHLVFNFSYKKVDNHRLPQLKKELYDGYYENIKFNIYVLNKNKWFIEEINNDCIKNYYIVPNYSNNTF
jgi:hypothetical protein